MTVKAWMGSPRSGSTPRINRMTNTLGTRVRSSTRLGMRHRTPSMSRIIPTTPRLASEGPEDSRSMMKENF